MELEKLDIFRSFVKEGEECIATVDKYKEALLIQVAEGKVLDLDKFIPLISQL